MSKNIWNRYPKKYFLEIMSLFESVIKTPHSLFYNSFEEKKMVKMIEEVKSGFQKKDDRNLEIKLFKKHLEFLYMVMPLSPQLKEAILYTFDRIALKLGG